MIETSWGGYRILEESAGRQVKLLVLKSGACMSYQSHEHRSELWNVVKGDLWMCLEGDDIMFPQGDSFVVDQGERHAAYNRSGSDVEIVEIWMGDDLREDDISRHPYVRFLSSNKWEYGAGNISQ